ncbi:MAG: RNA 2',3'-cyclic phosphodiesterase [Anaerolineae bacterium]|nr:RNA 2',3'-cyclic phosphodiesterase [Anaerolineae bacterium]
MPGDATTIRTFIAIDISETVRQSICRATAGLRVVADQEVKWVAPQNLHLTLKFLGETPASKLDTIQQAMTVCAGRYGAFEVLPNGLGAFPTRGRLRVIWVGLQAPESLGALATDLERALEPLGFPAEGRPFSPHLTIGRVRENASKTELAALGMALNARRSEELTAFEVKAVTLYRSDLRPSGPIYTRLFSAPLTVYNHSEKNQTI